MCVRHVLATLAALAIASSATGATQAAETPAGKPAPGASRAGGELQIREEIGDLIHSLFMELDFKRLDAMERAFRQSDERTPSGVQKLGQFHAWVQYSLPRTVPQDGCSFAPETFLDMWQSSSPTAPTPYIAKASALLDRAWCFRGEGRASDVAEGAWIPFHENIDAAAKLLLEHKAIASIDPEYYVVMENIYRAQGRERKDFQALLNEATALNPYYYRIYWGAYEYYQPQWFGSPADVDAVARYAIEHTRAHDGTAAYARFYWHASETGCGCWRDAIDWPTMKQAMRDLAVRFPDPWNFANFAKLSCNFSDKDEARRYFVKLGKDDGSPAWREDKQGWQTCRTLAGL